MTVAEQQEQYEIQDHNIAAGYVTYIVDLWTGDASDPAVGVERWIGVWHENDLESEELGGFDPDFNRTRYGYRREPKPEPLVWEQVEVIKEADDAARRMQRESEQLLDDNDDGGYNYQRMKTKPVRDLYQAFIDAIERLAVDDTDEEAWTAVEAWRSHNALRHEK